MDALGVAGVGEVRVGVHQERRAGPRVVVEDGADVREEVPAEGTRRGRIGRAEHAEVVRRGDGDLLVEAELGERAVQGLHRREKSARESGVVAREHLVADGERGDLGVRQEGHDVGPEPRIRATRVSEPGQAAGATPTWHPRRAPARARARARTEPLVASQRGASNWAAPSEEQRSGLHGCGLIWEEVIWSSYLLHLEAVELITRGAEVTVLRSSTLRATVDLLRTRRTLSKPDPQVSETTGQNHTGVCCYSHTAI
uniref:Uncharacterized protein n=1 Tax=Oryza barthii TaxID=65489 RepID=A0A0D3FG59_9ORYZ